MKPFHRFLIGATMCAAAIPAFADDFYLTTFYNQDENWPGDPGPSQQFTEIESLAKENSKTYMLMVERFTNQWGYQYAYKISSSNDSETVYYGPEETLALVDDDLTNGLIEGLGKDSKGLDNLDYEGVTRTLTVENNKYFILSKTINWTPQEVTHLLLTLVVTEDEDGNKSLSLNIKEPTEYNIPVGLPTFFKVYAGSESASLVKTGEYTYSAHLDKVSGEVSIKDDSDGGCLRLGVRRSTILTSDWSSDGSLQLYKAGSNTDVFEASSTNGKLNFNIYQGDKSGGYTFPIAVQSTTLYDVDFTFYYDMLFRTGTSKLLETNSWNKVYDVNDPTGKVMFEKTGTMVEQKVSDAKVAAAEAASTDEEKAQLYAEIGDIFAKAYNGQLSISYALTDEAINEIKNSKNTDLTFNVKSDVDSWAEKTMTYSDVITKSGEADFVDGTYIVYSYVYDNFIGAFYIQENFTTTTISEVASAVSAASEDDDDTTATTSTAVDTTTTETGTVAFKASSDQEGAGTITVQGEGEDAQSEQAVVEFSAKDSVKDTDTSDGVLFYAATPTGSESSKTTIQFYYNYTDPSKSVVRVLIEDLTVTGVNDLATDNDAPVEYFNLNGVRVDGSIPGLYIRRQGNKISKVIIK